MLRVSFLSRRTHRVHSAVSENVLSSSRGNHAAILAALGRFRFAEVPTSLPS